MSTHAWATEKTLSAEFSPGAGPNLYRVQFPPELGNQLIEMPISGGQFQMGVDAERGTARFITWRQEIDAIVIYGASTGDIVVRMDESQPSTGTFRPDTNSFDIAATFILEFDDTQLRNFGFTSPFLLTATEQGTFYGVGGIGTVGMLLEGSGKFGLGQFSYTCRTTALFKYDLPPHMGQPGDVNHDRSFDISDPVRGLTYLFQGTGAECPGALEVNGDGRRDISDCIYMFNYLFLGESPPPEPAVECSVAG